MSGDATRAAERRQHTFICLSTVMDWLCTPATPQMTMMAPSSTRSARSTSMVKSTWPGVSMMLQ
jgi:hypothetical protein